jgi:hypothetical protein
MRSAARKGWPTRPISTTWSLASAHLADERGWKLVDLLRVARARYDLETESRGEQFDGFEELVLPRYESSGSQCKASGTEDARDKWQVK